MLSSILTKMTDDEINSAYTVLDLTGASTRADKQIAIINLISSKKTNIVKAANDLGVKSTIEDIIGTSAATAAEGGSRVTRSRRHKIRRTRYNQRGGVSTAVLLTLLLSMAAATSASPVNVSTSPYTTNVPYSVASTASSFVPASVSIPAELNISTLPPGAIKARAEEFNRLHHEYLSKGVSLPVTKNGKVVELPNINLCASGDALCGTHPRYIMPQIKSKKEFMKKMAMAGMPVKVELTTIKIGDIKLSQSEVDKGRVSKKVGRWDNKKLSKIDTTGIYLSSGGDIVDGHHTVSALREKFGNDASITVYKINKPINWILKAAYAAGVPHVSRNSENPWIGASK